MSLRGFFSRKNTKHNRRPGAAKASTAAVQAEFLEDRVLLSAAPPILNNHGVQISNNSDLINNPNVSFSPIVNSLYSGNSAGQGLNVVLDGAAVNGNRADAVETINYSPGLIFDNNGSAGSELVLRNLQNINELRLDFSQFSNNDFAGLVVRLENVNINSIIIAGGLFQDNGGDGLCIIGTDSNVQSLQLLNNRFINNGGNGTLLQFQNSTVGVMTVVGNTMNGNSGNGIQIDLDQSRVLNLDMDGNTADGNAEVGDFAGAFLDLTDSEIRGSIENNTFTNNTFSPPLTPGLTQGDGLRIFNRRTINAFDQVVGGGLRNIDLDTIRGNDFSNNGGIGANIDLGRATTLRGTLTVNTINNNGGAGLVLQARDAQNAFDVTIGGDTVDVFGNDLDANEIIGNQGVGMAITLDDTSNVVGNTSGRFRILRNVISNTTDDGNINTQFAGEGLFIRARGTVSILNGAARILNSQIDGNTIEGNASHGIAVDVSEDSEVVDFLIGDEDGDGDGLVRNTGNIIRDNDGDGLNFLRRDASLARDVRIIDNLFEANTGIPGIPNTGHGISYTVRNDANVTNAVIIQHNDLRLNSLDGLFLSTQIDASLIAVVDNNLIEGNLGDGVETNAFEADVTDAETVGGNFTRNTIRNNAGIGLNFSSVVGALFPLVVGGPDVSFRNVIEFNGDDGIQIGGPGNAFIQNNLIASNGQNNQALDVHGDGKGIDINLDLSIGSLSITLENNIITNNFGDGLEILNRLGNNLMLAAYGNTIDENLGRGVDVLNSGGNIIIGSPNTYLIFGDGTPTGRNIIRSNGLEGFYTVNTTSPTQTQDVNATTALLDDGSTGASPNLTLDIDTNLIQSNGLPANFGQLNGSGLIMRVGTSNAPNSPFDLPDYDGADSPTGNGVGTSNSATFGNGRVNARVNGNTFGGNRGVDVLAESFVSTVVPPATTGEWDEDTFRIDTFTGDPLARFNLEITNNVGGQSVNLIRANNTFYSNAEVDFKSRTIKPPATPPNPQNPSGPFTDGSRLRSAQRLPGRGGSFTDPEFGPGGLLEFLPTTGTIATMTPGGPNVPILVTTVLPHSLLGGETILIDGGTTFAGFELGNLFEVDVVDGNSFFLVNTEGETDLDDFVFGLSYQTVNTAFLYPGVGPSTFRITEFNNDFSVQNFDDEGNFSFYDEEAPGAFNFRTLSVDNATATEGGLVNFTVTLDQPVNGDTEVFYHTEFAGAALQDVDFDDITFESAMSIIIPAGATTGVISITTLQDNIDEPMESFSLIIDDAIATVGRITETIAIPTNDTATGTILDDDNAPTISVSDATGFETGDGTGVLQFMVTLSNPSSTPVFVDFTTQDGTADADEDYRIKTGTVTFAGGETTRIVEVEILADQIVEGAENVFLQLSNLQGATPGDTRGSGQIFDTRFASITDAVVSGEGNGTVQAGFTISLSQSVPVGQQIQVTYETMDGSAVAGFGDYVTDTDTVTFLAGEIQKTIFITVNRDLLIEGDEQFFVNITSPQATIADGQGVGRILESLEIAATQDTTGQASVRVFNADTGQQRFTFTPYPGFLGDVRVATADLNGDGVLDIITAPGPGGGPHVKVSSGIDGSLITEFMAYDGALLSGVFLATGDINNDGIDDIITSPDVGGGPHIRVFSGTTQSVVSEFFAEGYGIDFRGGIRVASGNVDGLAGDDIIVGYGPGMPPRVDAFAMTPAGMMANSALSYTFAPYDVGFLGGVFVAAGDFGGASGGGLDGVTDIVTAPGAGGGPHVKIFNGSRLGFGFPADDASLLENFFAYTPAFQGGVRVATGNVSGDARPEVITAPGIGGGPHVKVFTVDANPLSAPIVTDQLFPFPSNLRGGTFITGRTNGQASVGSPLTLAQINTPAPTTVDELTDAELQPLVDAAISRLAASGEDVTGLEDINFVITDLDGQLLGLETPGQILIDRTGAGRGYFIDLTPNADEEFIEDAGRLLANVAEADGKVDLLTVLLHELGHALGEEHVDDTIDPYDLMAPTLLLGERRLPEFDSVFSSGDLFESLLDL